MPEQSDGSGETLSIAIAKHQQGLWEEAEKLYLGILAKEPQNTDVLHLIGILYGQIGEFSAAEEYLERLLKLSPDNPTYHNSMANIKKRLNDIEGAIFHYKRAIQLDAQSSTAYTNLASLLMLQGQLQEAKMLAEKAQSLNPNSAEAHYTLALVALKQDQPSLAIIELLNTLRLNPDHIQAHYTLAQQYQHASPPDLDKAILHYRIVLQSQPQFTDALVNYGSALLRRDSNPDDALKSFYQALEVDPNHYEAHYNLGCALLEQHKIAPALQHFLKAITTKPTAEAYYNIGVIYSYQDRHGDALEYLKKAIKLKADFFSAYNNLGTVYLKLDNIPKAIEHFEAAAKLQPNNEEIAYILSALKQEQTHERAPEQYVEHLFDQYAPYFDKHLLEHLKYETPKLLYEAVMSVIQDDLHLRPVLDLGCGTGLTGKLFKDIASPLIGVDLSSQMIAKAKEKNLYDTLIQGDLFTALKNHPHNELILASDVLTYLGDLSPLFPASYNALIPNGLFAFTIEVAPTEIKTYTLQHSIRYAHSPQYIETLCSQNHLTIIKKQTITLRLQHNKPLEGLLYIVKNKYSEETD